eukprot:3205794-Amphidinium_carterae.6
MVEQHSMEVQNAAQKPPMRTETEPRGPWVFPRMIPTQGFNPGLVTRGREEIATSNVQHAQVFTSRSTQGSEGRDIQEAYGPAFTRRSRSGQYTPLARSRSPVRSASVQERFPRYTRVDEDPLMTNDPWHRANQVALMQIQAHRNELDAALQCLVQGRIDLDAQVSEVRLAQHELVHGRRQAEQQQRMLESQVTSTMTQQMMF